MVTIRVRIPEDLVKIMDEMRGELSRSEFMAHALEEYLGVWERTDREVP